MERWRNRGPATGDRYSPEVRARAVRTVVEHTTECGSEWAAISSIAGKIGCTAETLRRWVRQAERDEGLKPGPTSADQARIRERENRELRQANEILRKASASECNDNNDDQDFQHPPLYWR